MKRAPKNDAKTLSSASAADADGKNKTGSSAAHGLHWQKYAGIGPERIQGQQSARISGEAIHSLGSLEAEIMGTLWEIGEPASSMDVAEALLYKRRSKGQEPASFATVTTTLRRLTSKGLLVTQKSDQRTPFYAPTVGREEMAARILNNVSVTLLGKSLSGLLPKLIGFLSPSHARNSEQEQEDLQRLMQALENTAEAGQKTSSQDGSSAA